MKQTILSAFVIVSFILYSFSMRHDDTHTVVTPAKSSSQATTVPAPTSSTSNSSTQAATYKDGRYTGSAADAFYGNIQVEATISGGKITAVQFLQYPNDRPNSVEINQQAMPLLQQEAIKAQSAHVNGVTGATDTSQAFVESLSSALSKAV
jgi:uncharacterized protein with FMN-binding domain